MVLISSKTLIKAHAMSLFVLAVYLLKSPEVIVESDVLFVLGEVLQIDSPTTTAANQPQSPFAMCGILLIADALVDLIIISRIPNLNEILEFAEASRRESSVPVTAAARMNPFLARLATLYSEIWTFLSAARFCLFFAVSFYIYQSKPGGGHGNESLMASGLVHLKNRVVFTYGFMEMMFWLWSFITIREERQEAAKQLAASEE